MLLPVTRWRRPRLVSVHITTIVVAESTGALTPTGGSRGVGGSGTDIITQTILKLKLQPQLNKTKPRRALGGAHVPPTKVFRWLTQLIKPL